MHIRGQHAHRREDARVDVGDRIAVFHGRPAGLARDRHQAREALCDEVEAALVGQRPVAAEAGDRAIDQRRVGCGEHVVAKAQLLERVAPEVFDEDIGGAHHAQQDLPALRPLEIERDAALAAIHHHERRRHAVDARLAISARVVPSRQLLDLDHVGAHVGEHGAARGPRHDLREFQHAHAGERTRMRRRRVVGMRGHRPRNFGLRLARNAA